MALRSRCNAAWACLLVAFILACLSTLELQHMLVPARGVVELFASSVRNVSDEQAAAWRDRFRFDVGGVPSGKNATTFEVQNHAAQVRQALSSVFRRAESNRPRHHSSLEPSPAPPLGDHRPETTAEPSLARPSQRLAAPANNSEVFPVFDPSSSLRPMQLRSEETRALLKANKSKRPACLYHTNAKVYEKGLQSNFEHSHSAVGQELHGLLELNVQQYSFPLLQRVYRPFYQPLFNVRHCKSWKYSLEHGSSHAAQCAEPSEQNGSLASLQISTLDACKHWVGFCDVPTTEFVEWVTLHNATLSNYAAFTDEVVYRNSEICGWQKWLDCNRDKLDRPRQFRGLRRLAKVLDAGQSFGTYHFWNEMLPRIMMHHEQLINDPEIYVRICCSGPDNQFMTDALEMLGIARERVIYAVGVGAAPVVADIVWVTQGTPCVQARPVPMLMTGYKVRAWMQAHAADFAFHPSSLDAGGGYILLLRRSRRRGVINQDEVQRRLEAAVRPQPGLQLFDTEARSYTQREIAVLFYRSKVIVGRFGAGLSNMLFAAPGSALVELHSSDDKHMYMIQAMALGLRYYGYQLLPGQRADPGDIVRIVCLYTLTSVHACE